MFWFRPKALLPTVALGWSGDAFEPEQGQREGTLAHAIERVLPLAARVTGYWIDTIPAPFRSGGGDLPAAVVRGSAQQLLEELGKVRELLGATEAGLERASELALERLSSIGELNARIDALQAALSHAQHLAWEREATLERLRRSRPIRLAMALRLVQL